MRKRKNINTNYVPPELDYYIMTKDGKSQIVSVIKDGDPLYEYGLWNCYSGPYTRDEALNIVGDIVIDE